LRLCGRVTAAEIPVAAWPEREIYLAVSPYFHVMAITHPYINQLLAAITEEENEEVQRFRLDEQHTLKALKAEGLALHPITVTRKNYGYADYPEIAFRLPFPCETNLFRDGAAIECFCQNEEPVKGILLSLEGKVGEMRLFVPDFPEWMEEPLVGIKLAPDQRTITIMKTVLRGLEKRPDLFGFFQQIHGTEKSKTEVSAFPEVTIPFNNQQLNQSQRQAVGAMVSNQKITIVHGPPGTGKTTTLVEAIWQLVTAGEKILVAAPSNTAVDTISKALVRKGVALLRVGNTSKVDAAIFPFTPEGKLSNSKQVKDIKELKKRAEEYRRMALRYKRNFGKAEREQRNLLFNEVKQIRTEIRKLQQYNEEKLFQEAQVIAGTPIGLYDAKLNSLSFHSLFIDEAGQCIEPLAWCVFPLAPKYVLAGDHLQLPPTIISYEAGVMGLNKSILEVCVEAFDDLFLLNTQYRMRQSIAGFSSAYFYKGLLQTAVHLSDKGVHLTFIDTAGSGYNETRGTNGMSLQNEGELMIVKKLLQEELPDLAATVFISPYSGQVAAAQEFLPPGIRISTIDSFQGQESENVIVSLVRSNEEGELGFLKDYRRMNVAITRARERLYVIGDSATIGADHFFNDFLAYVEQSGSYRSVWDFDA